MTAKRQVQDSQIIPAARESETVLYAHVFLALLAGLALRLLFAFRFPGSADDSKIYLQLAHNWVDHHAYALWVNGHLVPTDIRVPGYPAFLAGVAIILGRTIRAIVLSQVALDLGTCLVTAALSAALAPPAARRRVAIAALWLAATCPFTANYTAVVLTETLAAFLTTAALVSFSIGLEQQTARRFALLGAFLTGVATLVRPEMPLLLGVAALAYVLRWTRPLGIRKLTFNIALLAGAFFLPLLPWAARNLMTLHEGQIIASRYATMPGEYAPVGYYAWNGTWLARYRDVYLSVWRIGDEQLETEDLPASAFDSPEEKARIADLFQQYNDSPDLEISPEVDRQFAAIAKERTRRHPLRTYIRLPFERALTMWFTPRTELLPIDGKIWPIRERWEESHADFLTTLAFGALGYVYVALAFAGIWVAWRASRFSDPSKSEGDCPNLCAIGLVLTYLLVRTAFLTTVEAPEPRYLVPCYPAVLALVALLWTGKKQRE